MPKILIINKSPVYRSSGAETVVWELGRTLANRNWDVHYLCPVDENKPDCDNITIHSVQTKDGYSVSKASFFYKSLHDYVKVHDNVKPDIVYDNASPVPYVLPHILNHNLVTKTHSPYNGLKNFQIRNNIFESVGVTVLEQLYRFMDGERLSTVSYGAKKRFKKKIIRNSEEIKVFQNGIDVSKFKYNYSPDGPILALCELTKRKNIKSLLHAWDKLKTNGFYRKKNLVIAGDGPQKQLLENITTINDISDIEFLGFVSEKKKKELYTESYCYVLPTLMESFGLTNLEAMASGSIVVSTSIGGTNDYLEDRVNGLALESPNEKNIYQALRSLSDPNKLEKNMSENARRTAEKFNFKKSIHSEIEYLEELI